MDEVIVRPKHAGGRPKNPYTDTEEYKKARKKNRNKIDLETNRRSDNMKRIYEPADGERQSYYYAFHPKGEQALKRRRNLESLRIQKKRNDNVISELKDENSNRSSILSPNGQIFEQMAHNDLEKSKEIIINFRTSA